MKYILLFMIVGMFSACSMLQIDKKYIDNSSDSVWIKKSYGYYSSFSVKTEMDSLTIRIINHYSHTLSGGPPYLPVIPNFLFFLSPSDNFELIVTANKPIIDSIYCIVNNKKMYSYTPEVLLDSSAKRVNYKYLFPTTIKNRKVQDVVLYLYITNSDSTPKELPPLILKKRRKLYHEIIFAH